MVSIREVAEGAARAFTVHMVALALLILTFIATCLVLFVVKRKPVDAERAAAVTVRAWYAAVVAVLLPIVVFAVINNR